MKFNNISSFYNTKYDLILLRFVDGNIILVVSYQGTYKMTVTLKAFLSFLSFLGGTRDILKK